MLPKVHLTSHFKMSGSRWVTTPSWLSGSWRSFLYSSSVYSCHLFLTSASVRSIPFLSFIVPIFAWNIPLVSLIFLKKSLVFPILLFSSISLYLSLRKAFLSLFASLWNSAFKLCISFLFSFAFCFSSFHSYFYCLLRQPFFLFVLLFLGMFLSTASCTMSQTSIHSSSGTLSDLISSNDHRTGNC